MISHKTSVRYRKVIILKSETLIEVPEGKIL